MDPLFVCLFFIYKDNKIVLSITVPIAMQSQVLINIFVTSKSFVSYDIISLVM